MIKQNIIFIILLTFLVSNVNAQKSYNQFDANKKRHGLWKKNFEGTKQVRYQGEFDHGKEKGLFKFYKLVRSKSVLTATKLFSAKGVADVQFLTSTGNVISKGKMMGRKYIGNWTYYHKDSDKVMTKESYNDNGLLDGEKTIYFKNGQLAEKLNYVDGKEEGHAINYSEQGIVVKDFNYKNGELHGFYKDFNYEGVLIVEGQFKEGKKHSIWKYYENGKLKREKNYSNPKTFHKN